jgi:DNA-binding MarR family transcriptional regulator
MHERVEPAERNDQTYESVVATYKAMRRSTLELVAEEGLTEPQYQALKVMAKNGAVVMRKISDDMLVTPANVTGIVDRLEQKGLIKRTARLGDRRATVIELTPGGLAVQKRVASRYREFVQRAVGALTADEQRSLRNLLEKLQLEMSRQTQ